jgi:hypothetical protein
MRSLAVSSSRRGAAHQVATFGQVMLDQSRLVGVERAANAPAQPTPVFQVGQLMEYGIHEYHHCWAV